MTEFNPESFYEDMNETESNAVATLIQEGKLDRARDTVKKAAAERDMTISDREARYVVDLFRPDLSPEELTESQFPDKEDKPSMGMDVTEDITDPQHRRAPNPDDT